MRLRLAVRQLELKAIFAPRYRAVLLDMITLIFNLILMSRLTDLLASLAAQAGAGSLLAQAAMALFCLGLVFPQPLGALLKRRCAHQRNPGLSTAVFADAGRLLLLGYFVVQLMFLIFASQFLADAFGRGAQVSPEVLALLFVGIPAVAAANTFSVYFYFVPPKRESRLKFLAAPRSEALGDVGVFLSMTCFQALWWYLLADPYFSSRPASLGELAGKIISFAAMALILYFPPRIFYLAEDIDRKIMWLTMTLANLPIILRILFGAS